jgi:hypothetical protein
MRDRWNDLEVRMMSPLHVYHLMHEKYQKCLFYSNFAVIHALSHGKKRLKI